MRSKYYFLSWILLLASPTPALTQQPGGAEPDSIAEACRAEEHRQFDFWLGDWSVTNPDGQVVGSNRITRIAGGCALLESWRSARGGTGNSINMYEPRSGEWAQVWVSPGLVLRLSGGMRDGRMVLSGERVDDEGPVTDRITWTPRADGTVRQHWRISRDGGESWQTVFDGTYRRVSSDG